jgi:hypothetical protein
MFNMVVIRNCCAWLDSAAGRNQALRLDMSYGAT